MRLFLFSFCFLSTSIVGAAENFTYGFYPGAGSYYISSSEGDSESKVVFQPLDFFATYRIDRDSRLWVELGSFDDDFTASISEIGLQAKSIDFTVQYQSRYRVSKSFKPWFGIGAVFSDTEYTNRHLVDQNGFLAQTFESIESSQTALIVSMMLISKFDFGDLIYGISYKSSLDDGVSGVGFNVGVQF